jgi:hypothetical protein
MWHTGVEDTDRNGDRVLVGAELTVFAHGVASIVDLVYETLRTVSLDAPLTDDELDTPISGFVDTSVRLVSQMSFRELVATSYQVLRCLADATVAAPPLTAVNESMIAAVFDHVLGDIVCEIELSRNLEKQRSRDCPMRHKTLAACTETGIIAGMKEAYTESGSEGPVHWPMTAKNRSRDKWESLIEQLKDRVLMDRDYEMYDEVADIPPDKRAVLEAQFGVPEGYYSAIPETATAGQVMEYLAFIENAAQ